MGNYCNFIKNGKVNLDQIHVFLILLSSIFSNFRKPFKRQFFTQFFSF